MPEVQVIDLGLLVALVAAATQGIKLLIGPRLDPARYGLLLALGVALLWAMLFTWAGVMQSDDYGQGLLTAAFAWLMAEGLYSGLASARTAVRPPPE